MDSEQVAVVKQAARRTGYLVAIIVHVFILWVVNSVLDWGWPSWLTPEFDDLLVYMNASIIATIVIHLVWIAYDPAILKHLGELITNGFSFVAALRTWTIFPFDFSPYSFDWGVVVRILIAVGLFGIVVSTIVETTKLVRSLADSLAEPSGNP